MFKIVTVTKLQNRRPGPTVVRNAFYTGPLASVRDGKERDLFEHFFKHSLLCPIDFVIAQKGGLYRRDFNGVGLRDALIAASAEHADATLVTLNKKHFPMIKNVLVPYAKHMT